MCKLLRCSSISDLVMYFRTLPSSLISAPCILHFHTQLKRVCRAFAARHTFFCSLPQLGIRFGKYSRLGEFFVFIVCLIIIGQPLTRGLDKINNTKAKIGHTKKRKAPRPTKTKKIASAVFNFLSILCELLH